LSGSTWIFNVEDEGLLGFSWRRSSLRFRLDRQAAMDKMTRSFTIIFVI
jgi:hypothetical protein